MFTRKNYLTFFLSSILVLTGYLLMGMDPAEYGFGLLTLWVAPPLLICGFFLPVIALVNLHSFHIRWHSFKHLAGYAAFIIALITYLATLEPTASLWDCSEFIASAYKLQVPHTPGTPLALLIGRIFTMFAPDVRHVALTLNVMSAFFSALTVLLIYHLIYYFICRTSRTSMNTCIIAALCGSLCLTFSDTFWFSAVEAETYGAACFFLMLLTGMILKGRELHGPSKAKFLVLIFYLAGLAYCIHPMCILALTFLPFAWLSHHKPLRFWQSLMYLSAGILLVFGINRIVVIGFFDASFVLDKYLVNTFHLPFYSGVLGLVFILTGVVYFILKRYPTRSIFALCGVALIIGFAPYLMLFIRSNQNPPIDENNPENLALIRAYMSRESYPTSPLVTGPYYDAALENITVKRKIFHKTDAAYKFSGTISEYVYEPSRTTILPRMYSNDPDHIEAYRQWNGISENEKPTFSDNLYFMFTYQLGHMYLRYLMFNFAGRRSDHQNDDWLSPVESFRSDATVQNENKARNQYWMLPLSLGILGALFQFNKDRKALVSISLLFLINGIILVLYLNSPPVEPRERDYIYVGSFIAFCIWIGVGAYTVLTMIPRSGIIQIIARMLLIAVPLIMAFENYDDHNRTGRTFQIDNARNLLTSCAPNSILFTGGDNDTFPLWYLQDVEGVRTDVRVMVLSYMNTDWYINQLRRPYYLSKPFQLTLGPDDYLQYGANDVLYIQNTVKDGIDFDKYLSLLKDKHPALQAKSTTGEVYSILPSKLLKLKIDSQIMSRLTSQSRLAQSVTFQVSGNYMTKSALAILDIVSSNKWQRPVYFNYTALNTSGLDLQKHVVQEGNVYRLAPVNDTSDNVSVDLDRMYANLISNADYSGLKNKNVYFNYEDFHARIITPLRQSFNTLAVAYLRSGDATMAKSVLGFALKNIYYPHLDPSYSDLQTADLLVAVDRKEQAVALCRRLFDFHYQQLRSDQLAGRSAERVDLFLAQEASKMLDSMDESQPDNLFNDLELVNGQP